MRSTACSEATTCIAEPGAGGEGIDRGVGSEVPDLKLGDGLYNYWRTVISRSVKGLPDFADKRLGIEQMEYVQDNGIFLGPAATFALTYTWLKVRERATQTRF